MACRSASVQRAQKKSERALKAIEELEKNIKSLAKAEEDDFQNKIDKSKLELGVDDFEKIDENNATKVDFTHEFNADSMIPVITNILKAAAATIAGANAASVIINPENIKTYANLLSSITEAIKTKSTTGATTSFSVNRLAPGFFSFTSTKSKTITDKETFGEESITASTFYNALYFSKKHAAKISSWSTILTLIEMIRKVNEARIGLVDRLVENTYTLAEFTKLSNQYKQAIENYESELSVLIDEQSVVGVVSKALSVNKYNFSPTDIIYNKDESLKILMNATEILGTRGQLYSPVLRETNELLMALK